MSSGPAAAKAERRVVIVDDEEVERLTVLPNDAGALGEDTFQAPRSCCESFSSFPRLDS